LFIWYHQKYYIEIETFYFQLILVTPNEPGVVIFRVDGLQCQIFLNQIHMQSLHLKATHAPYLQTHEQPFQFSPEELQVRSFSQFET
jgi:hypothetical protein